MTQLEFAKKGTISPALKKVAREESLHPDELVALVARGQVVIPFNSHHPRLRPLGIGRKLRTKVNVNIGTSRDFPGLEEELKKVDVSLRYGADTIMDLSTGGRPEKDPENDPPQGPDPARNRAGLRGGDRSDR